jgi:hypothetical protein
MNGLKRKIHRLGGVFPVSFCSAVATTAASPQFEVVASAHLAIAVLLKCARISEIIPPSFQESVYL